jgi:3-oxoacyl-[acyl-carrier protein] reductase
VTAARAAVPEPLQTRVAVITGGGSGIGLATARRFLAEGVRVEVWDLAPEGALATLGGEGWGEAIGGEAVDVRDRGAVARAAARLVAAAGRIDILVNNAGVTLGYLDLGLVTDEAWSLILDTNLKGAVNCAQAVAPIMKRQRWGRIVNVASILARFGMPGQTAYAASKAALVGLTRVWARELGGFGINVNAVSPGYIRTPMNARNEPELVRQVLDRTPVGRLGEPEDVASALAFLCSESASFVNGVVLPVDGGLVL